MDKEVWKVDLLHIVILSLKNSREIFILIRFKLNYLNLLHLILSSIQISILPRHLSNIATADIYLSMNVGSLVFAYHGPLIYQAKVMKFHAKDSDTVEVADGTSETPKDNPRLSDMSQDMFFIHYQGWKTKWDEWVGKERLLIINDENEQLKKELEMTLKPRKRKLEEATTAQEPLHQLHQHTTANGTTGPAVPGVRKYKKRKSSNNYEITVKFPNELKYLLVDDWEFITKNRQLVSVPATKPVHRILQDYLEFKSEQYEHDQTKLNVVKEMLVGLETYFNKALLLLLLYKYERLQLLNLLKEDRESIKHLSEIYGVEHLLRLISNLPSLLGETSMDSLSLGVLVSEVDQLLVYIKENLALYINEYVNTHPNYDSLARA